MRRGTLLRISLVLIALVLVGCRPVKDPPPAQPTAPPLPAAPGGNSTSPAVFVNDNGTTQPFGAPDPDVIAVDASYCASIPAVPPATTTTSTTAPTTTTTTAPLPPAGAPGCYYTYSTPTIRFAPTAVPVSRSKDLVHWYPAGSPDTHGNPSGLAFDGGDPTAFPGTAVFPLWAPSVVQAAPNRFVMWFADMTNAPVNQMCLFSASASSPDGPFRYTHGPYCKIDQWGLIDPSVVVDGGTAYITFKTEGLTSPYVPTRIYEAQLNGTWDDVLPGTDHQLLEVLPAPSNEYPIVEAPTMMRSPGGTLFLLYSAYNWYTAGYKVDVARCDNPWGPCNRVYSTPVLASRDAMLGPGGQTPFKDAAGNWQLAFHAWAAADLNANPIDGSLRSLRVLPITFPDGNPKVG